MVLGDITRTVAIQMEIEQRRTVHVKRSQVTIQTAVDGAVVNTLVVVGTRRDTSSHFDSMRRVVEEVIKRIEDDRRQLLMKGRVS